MVENLTEMVSFLRRTVLCTVSLQGDESDGEKDSEERTPLVGFETPGNLRPEKVCEV